MEEDSEFSDLLQVHNNQSSPSDSTSNSTSDTEKNGLKPKRRSTEKRRQQAVVASRNRRGAEAIAFQELAQTLPISAEALKTLDKLGMLRVAACYVKMRAVLDRLQPTAAGGAEDWLEADSLLQDGFLVVMSTGGELIYVSDGVKRVLRQEKHSIIGSSIYDHVHKSSHSALDRLLAVENVGKIMPAVSPLTQRQMFKAPSSTAVVQLQGGNFTTARITGKVFMGPEGGNFYVGVVEPLKALDPLDYEFPFPQLQVFGVLDFVCTVDLRCLNVDLKMTQPIHYHYHPEECRGVSVFEFIHAEDISFVRDGLKWMYQHGHVQSPTGYRMLIKNGGWAWFLTHASTMQIQTQRADGVVEPITYCVGRHFMVSDIQEAGSVLAPIQLGVGALPIPHDLGAALPSSGLPALAETAGPDATSTMIEQSALTAVGGEIDLDFDLLTAETDEVVDVDTDALMEEFAALVEEGFGFSTSMEPVAQIVSVPELDTTPIALSGVVTPETGNTNAFDENALDANASCVRSQFPTLTSLLTL